MSADSKICQEFLFSEIERFSQALQPPTAGRPRRYAEVFLVKGSPPPCQPTINWLSRGATTRTTPSVDASQVANRPGVAHAFLLCSLDVATDSERRRQVNPCKVYPVDTGLIALFDRSGKSNVGHALETMVCMNCNAVAPRLTMYAPLRGTRWTSWGATSPANRP